MKQSLAEIRIASKFWGHKFATITTICSYRCCYYWFLCYCLLFIIYK